MKSRVTVHNVLYSVSPNLLRFCYRRCIASYMPCYVIVLTYNILSIGNKSLWLLAQLSSLKGRASSPKDARIDIHEHLQETWWNIANFFDLCILYFGRFWVDTFNYSGPISMWRQWSHSGKNKYLVIQQLTKIWFFNRNVYHPSDFNQVLYWEHQKKILLICSCKFFFAIFAQVEFQLKNSCYRDVGSSGTYPWPSWWADCTVPTTLYKSWITNILIFLLATNLPAAFASSFYGPPAELRLEKLVYVAYSKSCWNCKTRITQKPTTHHIALQISRPSFVISILTDKVGDTIAQEKFV